VFSRSQATQVALANTMSAWVIQYGLDGIDVDYEVGTMSRPAIYRRSSISRTSTR
jgi:chitinase